MVRFFQICSVSLFLISSLVFGQTLYNNFPVTNGSINAIVQSGNNIFLGGVFSYVGPNTGRFAAIDPSTGLLISGFPDVNGTIYKVVSDDAGGWYIGGTFTYVGGYPRNAIAHINSDKTVDTWNPNVNDGIADNLQRVFTITKYGSTIYVGGLFEQVGSDLRKNVAAIDSATGLATSWNPRPDNAVYSIIVTPQYTFLGGTFTYFSGAIDTTNPANIPGAIPNNKRQALAELYTGQNILTFYNTQGITGAISCTTPYGPSSGVGVYAMQLVNGRLYVAGNFGTFNGTFCYGLTSVDTTNIYYPVATGFAPNKNNSLKFRPPFALAVSGDTVFVGGEFLYFGPLNTVRHHIAAALISTGTGLSTWNPDIATNGANEQTSNPYYVSSITVANGTVYASGKFKTINTSISRSNLAAIGQSTGTVTSWNPNPSSLVFSTALIGSSMYIGGDFTSVNGQTRNNLASINALSGELNSWNPNPNSNVLALAASGTTLFVSGYFSSIGGQSRSGIAGIDIESGLATDWYAASGASCLAVNNGMLFIGGSSAVDTAVTAGVSSFVPAPDGTVYSIAVSGSTVYVGGSFQNIGGQPRNSIAALDATTGLATSWNPYSDNLVLALSIQGSNIYAGGRFTNIGGLSRNHLACIDAVTGNATSWDPNITGPSNPEVTALALANSIIYAGGIFSSVGVDTRNYVAGIDVATGNATSWAPNTNNQVNAISFDPTNQKIYLGGYFTTTLNRTASYFAVVDDPSYPWSIQLSLTASIEGFFNKAGYPDVMHFDLPATSPTVSVTLFKASDMSEIETQTVVLNNTGIGTFTFTSAVNGVNYYIRVKSLTTLETWSANPVSFTAGSLSYDFTTAADKSYNSNAVLVGGKYCMFSGDLDHDGAFSILDYIGIDNDIFNFADYNAQNDLDGDGAITILDYIPIDNSIFNFIGIQAPPGAPVPTPNIKVVRLHATTQVKTVK